MSYLGENTKKLGFGLMRLPKKDGVIDVEETSAMVDRFMEEGFTYFDTAWIYDGSEEACRKALVERYPRESYTLATKMAAWMKCETREDAIKQFHTSLERSGAGYFDYYLLHNLGNERTDIFDKFDLWSWALEMKKTGLIKHIGFSFHSTADELERILEAHPEAEFVQLQINYADWDSPSIQSGECYRVARKYDKPVVIMEPIRGGLLATAPPEAEKILKEIDPELSIASWAIRYAASLPGVITVLSGMSSLEQMNDNLSYMKNFEPLDEVHKNALDRAIAEIKKIKTIPCTSCDYCAKVCPSNIGISGSFKAMNIYKSYANIEVARRNEKELVINKGLKQAGDCIKCGACEEACPQHIHIRDELEQIANTL